MQGRPAHLRRRARVRGLAPDFVCNMTKQRTKSNKNLWVLLGGALLLRLVLALVTDGYPYDMSCFVAWGDKLAAEGPAAFYSDGYFADYPPGYLWVLGLVGAVRATLHIAYESKWTYFLLALVPSLCDCGLAWLVYRMAKRSSRSVKEHTALVLTAFTAFNPLMRFDTGVWKQIDGAFALPLVLCFVLLEQRRYLPAAVLYGVALAIKPQALLFGPVLAVCYLAAITLEKDRLRAFGRCFGGAALALLPPLLTGLPFFGVVQLIPKLIDKYTGTMSGYPYATINAFNWLAALGGNWKGQADPALFGISWQQLGCLNILLVTAGLAYDDPGHGYFGSLDVQYGFYGMIGWRIDLNAGKRWSGLIHEKVDLELSAGTGYSSSYWGPGVAGFDQVNIKLAAPVRVTGVDSSRGFRIIPFIQLDWAGNTRSEIRRYAGMNAIEDFRIRVGVEAVYRF